MLLIIVNIIHYNINNIQIMKIYKNNIKIIIIMFIDLDLIYIPQFWKLTINKLVFLWIRIGILIKMLINFIKFMIINIYHKENYKIIL